MTCPAVRTLKNLLSNRASWATTQEPKLLAWIAVKRYWITSRIPFRHGPSVTTWRSSSWEVKSASIMHCD